MVYHLAAVLVQGHHVAGVDHDSILLLYTHKLGQLPLGHTVAVLAMDGDGELWMHQGINQLKILLAGMS